MCYSSLCLTELFLITAMKSCPTCNRTFEDTFTFCLMDGSVLSAPYDEETKKAVPSTREPSPPKTEVMNVAEREPLPPTRAATAQDLRSTIASPPPAIRHVP